MFGAFVELGQGLHYIVVAYLVTDSQSVPLPSWLPGGDGIWMLGTQNGKDSIHKFPAIVELFLFL